MKKNSSFVILMILAYPLIFSGCANIFSDISEKGFYKAVLFEANQQIAEGNYEDAISTINNNLAGEQLNKGEVRWALSRAYAGACGMDALQQIIDLGNLGTSTLFEIFLAEFNGTTVTKQGYCDNAVLQAQTLGAATNRKTIENYLMLFGSWAKLGTYVSINGDIDANETVDVGFDPCDNGDLAQAQVDEMVMSFGNLYTSLSALIASGVNDVSDLATLDLLCASIDAVDPSYNICSVLNTADVTDAHRVTMRCLVDGSDVGLSVSGNSLIVCIDDGGGNAVCPP